ncbi:MAG: hypothetical protein PWR31_2106 [Bacillota bacterium]|nr:hypothetical protein [Bacillota bacterium]
MRKKAQCAGAWLGAALLTAWLVFLATVLTRWPPVWPALAARAEALEAAQELLKLRAGLLVRGDPAELKPFYATETVGGAWALEKEQARIAYVRRWGQVRNIAFTSARVEFTRSAVETGEKKAGISLCTHTLLTYRHLDRPEAGEATLGWRTVHWLELAQGGPGWQVEAEWYLDPLEDASRNPSVAAGAAALKGAGAPEAKDNARTEPGTGAYRRAAAVRYADRFAGVKVGPGTGRYNQAYRDFTGLGGDCANFVSQVLTDKDAGNLKPDWGWFYADGEGSEAWLKAEALVYHLVGSGRAACLAKGTLAEVAAAGPDGAEAALRRLRPGDIIAYEEDGEIAHVSLVVGRDGAGYVLVNSHSADRYHVPWDFGYNADTSYWFLAVQG